MRDIIKPGIVLFVITLILSFLLGVVNVITKPIIEENIIASRNESMIKVLPSVLDNNFSEDYETGETAGVTSYNIGYAGDEACGYVFTVLTKGYSGDMNIMIGIDMDGNISGVVLGENNETPGLGKNAELPSFTSQYLGKSGKLEVVKIKKDTDNEIEAIAAATITSKAVTNAVNEALAFYNETIKGGSV